MVQGKVSGVISSLERTHITMSQEHIPEEQTPEQLQVLLQEQEVDNTKLQQQVETIKLQNQLEVGKMQQEQWRLAIQRLKEAREQAAQEHEDNMVKIRNVAPTNKKATAAAWLQEQLEGGSSYQDSHRAEEELHKAQLLEDLRKQQEDIHRQIADITGTRETTWNEPARQSTGEPRTLVQLKTGS